MSIRTHLKEDRCFMFVEHTFVVYFPFIYNRIQLVIKKNMSLEDKVIIVQLRRANLRDLHQTNHQNTMTFAW